MSICHSGRGAVFIMAAASLFPSLASAIVSINDEIELEGFLQARNILRTPRFEDAEFIMQRNTAQIEGKYYFLKDSTAFGRFDTGRLEYATFSFVGRSVYDSIYDVRESYDDSFPSYQDQPGDFEAKLREAYVDLVLPPFSLRLGKQQVVWGETDNFRALDVINPLDLSWHWSWESWEDIRIPLWMARGVYDVGKLGPLEESFVEVVWIPWDVRQNTISTDPADPGPSMVPVSLKIPIQPSSAGKSWILISPSSTANRRAVWQMAKRAFVSKRSGVISISV